MTSKLAARLSREMKKRDMSYAEFAEFLGVPKTQAYDWVQGLHSPNLKSIRRIAETLECDIADLIEAA